MQTRQAETLYSTTAHVHDQRPVVNVLFARRDSVYKKLPGCDAWDAQRDALTWPGGSPVIAHPPCRAWGRLRHFAKPCPGERNLARWAVQQVRAHGGVLEHPAHSRLWVDQHLPMPGAEPDIHGGWTLPITQHWWGHRAEKLTWLYIVGCTASRIPQMPLRLGSATHVLESRKRVGRRPSITKAEREHTPRELAIWLINLALRCTKGGWAGHKDG